MKNEELGEGELWGGNEVVREKNSECGILNEDEGDIEWGMICNEREWRMWEKVLCDFL